MTGKKATINSINKKENKCFQYTIKIALNHEEIKGHPERITKIKNLLWQKPFMDKYYWEEINYQSEKNDWKKIEKNYLTICLNVLYAKKDKNYSAYVSKVKSKREEQVILLTIPNKKRLHYIPVKSLSTLLRGIASKQSGD